MLVNSIVILDIGKLDYTIISKILNGELVDYNLENKKLIISTVTYEILYVCFLESIISSKELYDKMHIIDNIKQNIDEYFYSPYTPMYIYLLSIKYDKIVKMLGSNNSDPDSILVIAPLIKISKVTNNINNDDLLKTYNHIVDIIIRDTKPIETQNNYYLKVFK